jgi:outer membrane protein
MTILGTVLCVPSVQAQEVRIAVVDVETLTLASDEGKAAGEKYKKRLDEITGIMEKARKEIESKESLLRTQERVMSSTAKAQLTKEIETLKTDFERKGQDFEKELAEVQEQLIAPVSERARIALEAYIKEKSFSLVFDLSAQGSNVVWKSDANDITLDVIRALNEASKKAGTVPPAAPAPAAARPPATTAPATNRVPPVPPAPGK